MSEPSALVRLGGVVGAAAVGALLSAVPGAIRLGVASDVGFLRAWLTLAGVLAVPMLVLVPLARAAASGLRGFFPPDGSGVLPASAAVGVFVCTWFWSLSAFGAALRAQTHHRALGGVTFAFVAVGSMALLGLVALRLSHILRSLLARANRFGAALSGGLVVLSLALVALRIARAAPALGMGTRAALVDGLATGLAIAFAARRPLFPRSGGPILVFLLLFAVHTLSAVEAREVVARLAPLHALVMRLVW